MRRLKAGGSVLALAMLCAATAPAQTLLDRPLWLAIEPTAEADSAIHLARSYGPSGGSNGVATPAQATGEWSEAEYNSLGCIIGGTVGTVAAVAIAGPNIVNMIAGGIVPAATPGAFYAGLAGVVFASFCAVGQAATPAVMLAYRNATTAFGANEPEATPAPARPREEPPAPLLGRLIKVGYEEPTGR